MLQVPGRVKTDTKLVPRQVQAEENGKVSPGKSFNSVDYSNLISNLPVGRFLSVSVRVVRKAEWCKHKRCVDILLQKT